METVLVIIINEYVDEGYIVVPKNLALEYSR